MELNTIHQGDWIELAKQLDNEIIDCIMTSPPYWGLRDYGVKGQLGLEPHPNEYIKKLVEGFEILKTKLKKTGSLYLNLGDTYFGNSSYSNDGRQGYEEKTGMMMNAKRTGKPDPKLPRRLRAREQFKRPSREAYKQTGIIKNCLLCGKEIKGKGGKAFCSRECLNKKGNTFRSQNRTGWLQPKQLMLIPSRVAIAMQERGWILRNDIIWQKPNPMPSSVKDRLNNTYEHIFHFVKNKKYYYDLQNIKEPYKEPMNRWGGDKLIAKSESTWDTGTGQETYRTRNMRPDPSGKNPGDIFTIPTQPFSAAHFATYPEKLCEQPLKSSCPKEGVVLDPFAGSGTTLKVSKELGLNYIGFELNEEYIKIARMRIKGANNFQYKEAIKTESLEKF